MQMRDTGAYTHLHFIPFRPSSKTSQREVELEKSEVRAHAAKVFHAQRKDRSRQWLKSKAGCGTRLIQAHTSDEKPPIQSPPVIYQAVEDGSSGKLDPFLKLAVNLPRRDRDLVHFYLKSVPSKLYGISGRPFYCPVRDCSIPQLASNSVFVGWVLFAAETMMLSVGKIDPNKATMVMTARRASNYHHMREVMADRANWTQDEKIYGLVVAAIAECRAGDVALAQKHLRIAIDLLNRRGGLKTIQTMTLAAGSILLYAFVSIPLPLFQHRQEMKEAFVEFEQSMEALDDTIINVTLPSALRRYFSPDLAVQWVSQLATLHLLTMILSSCNFVDGPEFIQRLERMVKGSQGSEQLSSLARLFMICSCASAMGWWNNSHSSPFRSWETVTLVTLMDSAPNSRRCVIENLANRLQPGTVALPLDLQAVKAEIFRDVRRNRNVDARMATGISTSSSTKHTC